MSRFKEYLKEIEDLEAALKHTGQVKSTFNDAPIDHPTMKKALLGIGLSRGPVENAQKNPSKGSHYHYWMDREGDSWPVADHAESARSIHQHLFNDRSPQAQTRLRQHGGMVQLSAFGGHLSFATHDGLNPKQHEAVKRIVSEKNYSSVAHQIATKYREASSDSPTFSQDLGNILRLRIRS